MILKFEGLKSARAVFMEMEEMINALWGAFRITTQPQLGRAPGEYLFAVDDIANEWERSYVEEYDHLQRMRASVPVDFWVESAGGCFTKIEQAKGSYYKFANSVQLGVGMHATRANKAMRALRLLDDTLKVLFAVRAWQKHLAETMTEEPEEADSSSIDPDGLD